MDLKQFKVVCHGKIRPVAYEYLKDKVNLVDQQQRKFTKEELLHELEDADALFSATTLMRLGEAELAGAKKLQIIGQFSMGYDHIDLAYCRSRGIRVTNTPGISADSVADIAQGMLIDAARQIVRGNAFVHAGEWGRRRFFGVNTSLAGKTLGIIGMGSVGCEVARRGLASKMKIVYHNPAPRADAAEFQATFLSLEELLKSADFVVLCTALTSETTKLMNAETFAMMKPNAALINVSRGKVVDSDALYDALANGVIRYAAADVTDPEPLPGDHKLLTLPNFVCTPHVGAATNEVWDAMAMCTADNILACLAGKPLLTEVK